jgi:hypothetical protein
MIHGSDWGIGFRPNVQFMTWTPISARASPQRSFLEIIGARFGAVDTALGQVRWWGEGKGIQHSPCSEGHCIGRASVGRSGTGRRGRLKAGRPKVTALPSAGVPGSSLKPSQ